MGSLRDELQNYASGRRESVKERELARRLRALPDGERFELIRGLLVEPDWMLRSIGLVFTRRCLRRPNHFRSVLWMGLKLVDDPSEIKMWLRAVIHALGIWRTVRVLRAGLEVMPEKVGAAIYHLRFAWRAVPRGRRDDAEFWNLVKAASERSALGFNPDTWADR